MAGQARQRRAKPEGEENGRLTRRVVLRRERVLVLPEGVEPEQIVTDTKTLQKLKVRVGEAWVVVGEFEGASKTRAIEAHAGKPNTATAIAGAYKAPSVSAWAGGLVYESPPEPLVERRVLED